MSDWIDDLVTAQLEIGPNRVSADKCAHCRLNFHGLPKYGCHGAFGLSDDALTAVESQGVMDWTEL